MTALCDVLCDAATPSISFEFFPPKTDEGERALWSTIRDLQPFNPTFVSVTYGAGGSSRDRTVGITGRIQSETNMTAMAHLTCVNATAEAVLDVVEELDNARVRAIMALRGDPPGGFGAQWEPTPGGFNHASELVAAIRERERPDQPFIIGVAAFPEGHPESSGLDDSARWLAFKLEQADFAITQMFFDIGHYEDLVMRASQYGATKPIIPGIMPPTSASQISRMVTMSGGSMPDRLLQTLSSFENPSDQASAGIDWATQFAQSLIDAGAPGIHLYTLNKSTASQELVQRLTLPTHDQ
ncbi:methylenetetrahydrofolate reductase [Stomatohabitans albus]|uniref:methylenetetrahydrofolate reductase n=1 Tax=Stomatohabitans albus TaxID=3110766 RepID=UPI00300C0520